MQSASCLCKNTFFSSRAHFLLLSFSINTKWYVIKRTFSPLLVPCQVWSAPNISHRAAPLLKIGFTEVHLLWRNANGRLKQPMRCQCFGAKGQWESRRRDRRRDLAWKVYKMGFFVRRPESKALFGTQLPPRLRSWHVWTGFFEKSQFLLV